MPMLPQFAVSNLSGARVYSTSLSDDPIDDEHEDEEDEEPDRSDEGA